MNFKHILFFIFISTFIFGCTTTIVKKEEIQNSIKEMYITEYHNFIISNIDSIYLDSLSYHYKSNDGIIHNINIEEWNYIYSECLTKYDCPKSMFSKLGNSDTTIFVLTGEGLWGKLYGILLFDTSKNTITKVKFYNSNEDQEYVKNIFKDEYSDQFTGKLCSKNNKITFGYEHFHKEYLHKIDGVSGASVTSKGIIEMVNESLSEHLNKIN